MPRKPLSVRLDEALVLAVKAEAGERGQKVTTFVQRALESALRVCSCGATGFGDERARRHGAECMYAAQEETTAEVTFDESYIAPRAALDALAGLKCPKASCKYTGPEDHCPWHKLALKPARTF